MGGSGCKHPLLPCLLLTSCCASWFLTGHGLVPVRGPGIGDPCSRGLGASKLSPVPPLGIFPSLQFTDKMVAPMWHSGKESTCQCRRLRRHGLDPWVGKIPWRRKWLPSPVFLPGESHGQRSLEGYSPQDCKESDITEVTQHECTHV